MRSVIACLVVGLTGWAGAAMAEVRHFQSPSGNIRCVIAEAALSYVRCDLGVDRRSYAQRPDSCTGDWGTSFAVMGSGSGFVNCRTSVLDAPQPPEVLPYGATLEIAGFTCRSATTGVTCRNPEGGGFAVRRAAQRIF